MLTGSGSPRATPARWARRRRGKGRLTLKAEPRSDPAIEGLHLGARSTTNALASLAGVPRSTPTRSGRLHDCASFARGVIARRKRSAKSPRDVKRRARHRASAPRRPSSMGSAARTTYGGCRTPPRCLAHGWRVDEHRPFSWTGLSGRVVWSGMAPQSVTRTTHPLLVPGLSDDRGRVTGYRTIPRRLSRRRRRRARPTTPRRAAPRRAACSAGPFVPLAPHG